ncbi:hypothetical protein ACROYT_G037174 [Oculina patagonica]
MSFNSTKALETAKYFIEDIEDPVNAIPVVLLLLCFIWSGSPRCKHSALAWWALINGCIIHCWMDGVVGTTGRGPKWMVVEYAKLDARYWPTKDPLVMMISYVELAIMGPLCILWYRSIVKDLWWRHFMSIIVSTFQLMGAILYCSTEAYGGFKHVPLDWPPTFDSFEKIFYFWTVFVFANSIWIVVPTTIMLQTLSEMAEVYNPPRSKAKKRN